MKNLPFLHPLTQLPELVPKLFHDHSKTNKYIYAIYKLLNNKITLIKEDSKLPSICRIGVLIPRNNLKTKECQALSLLYKESGDLYRKFKNNGGDSNMTYDDDLLYWSGSWIDDNRSIDLISEVLNGIYKFKEDNSYMNKVLESKVKIYNYLNQLSGDNEENLEKEEFRNAIMGYNVENKENNSLITISKVNSAIKHGLHLSPHHIIVTSGISNQAFQKISSLISELLSPCLSSTVKKEILIPQFKLIDKRNFLQNPSPTNIKLIFPCFPWSSPKTPAYNLINEIFGSATPFSVGGPGKGIFSRSYEHVLKKKGYIISCKSLHYPSKYFGLFGFDFSCFTNERQTVADIIETIHNLGNNLSQSELNRAKNILSRKILSNLGNNIGRVEDAAKSYYYFNEVMGEKYIDLINKVSVNEIYESINYLIKNKNKSMLFIKGNKSNVSKIPKVEKIINLF